MSPALQVILRRRLLRRGGGDPGTPGNGPGRGARLKRFALIGLAGASIAALLVVAAGFFQYSSIAAGVVPPEEIIAKLPRGGARIYDRNGKTLYEFVDGLSGLRRPVAVQDMSPWITKATVAVEDPSFYTNNGVNTRGIIRAGVENFAPFLTGGSFLQGSGGSSITQQLAKNVYIPREQRSARSVTRKLREMVIAVELTKKYEKNQILEWYLNSISYSGVYVGIEAAAEGYFGKSAHDLTLAEASLLAGIPQSPARYNPLDPTNIDVETGELIPDGWSKWRQGEVLSLMVRRGEITQEEADKAFAEKLEFKQNRFDIRAPHFVLGRVATELQRRFGDEALFREGLEVTTSIDLDLQTKAEELLEKNITDFGEQAGLYNGAFVALDPANGQILAYVGSRDYFNDKIEGRNDNAVARNSPGSTLKPFTYMTAFQKGWGTGTAILDTPFEMKDASTGETFAPRNPDGNYQGPITAAKALGNSLNISAIKTIIFAGIPETIATLKAAGFTTFDRPTGYGPALTTGGSEVTLLDLTYGYSVLASGGIMRGQPVVADGPLERDERTLEPVALLKVTESTGKVRYEYKQPQEKRAFGAEFVYLVTSILSDGNNTCITYGVCNALGIGGGYPSAAKTGTSAPFDDFRKIGETWTAGYTPTLAAATWAGNANNAPIDGITSTSVSLRTWREFMEYALPHLKAPAQPFTRPGGVVEREVCWPSGRLPSELCPKANRYTSLFAESTVPSDPKKAEQLFDSWWQKVQIDTRTGQRAVSGTPPTFLREEVRLVLPKDDVAKWTGMQEWAVRNGVSSLLAPVDVDQQQLVLLTSPQQGQQVSGTIALRGRAHSDDFRRYTVEFARGTSPTAWSTLQNSTASTLDGVLATWDTTRVADGDYTIRVTLEDAKLGIRQYRTVVRVTNGGAAGREAPVLLVTAPANESTVSGNVSIVGTAASADFLSVVAEVGDGLSPTAWRTIGTNLAAVRSGVLGGWDTTKEKDGTYTVRVTLRDRTFGNTTSSIVLIVSNKKPN